jgi:hypothetical protein
MTRNEAKRRLETRKVKAARAKRQWHKAQEAYENAAAKHLPIRERLKYEAARAKRAYLKRQKGVKEAREAYWQHPDRFRVKPELRKLSQGRSSRYGAKPTRIVLHITVSHNRPGLSDVSGMLSYLYPASVEASAHIVNDAEGHDGRCVEDDYSAWTQAAYNRDSLSIEQIEYADKPRDAWFRENKAQLENTATWIAHWSHLYDIPIKQSTSHGVCQHRDLGAAGGGHSDVGNGYPMDYVLNRARAIRKLLYRH